MLCQTRKKQVARKYQKEKQDTLYELKIVRLINFYWKTEGNKKIEQRYLKSKPFALKIHDKHQLIYGKVSIKYYLKNW